MQSPRSSGRRRTRRTAWAATTTGRVFVTKNVDAPGVDEFPPATGNNVRRVAKNVVWHRIDLPTTPGRFVSSIHVDSTNGNRAWVSYSGFSVNTPATPGHVFEVTFDPASGDGDVGQSLPQPRRHAGHGPRP